MEVEWADAVNVAELMHFLIFETRCIVVVFLHADLRKPSAKKRSQQRRGGRRCKVRITNSGGADEIHDLSFVKSDETECHCDFIVFFCFCFFFFFCYC